MLTVNQAKKKYNNQLKAKKFSQNKQLYLKDNIAVIDAKLENISDIFSSFDIESETEISKAFSSFLLKEINIIPINHEIELELLINIQPAKHYIKRLDKSIKRHFSFRIVATKLKLKRNLIKAITLFGFSALSLLCTFFTRKYSTFFVDETLLILSWFFLWEGSNILLFNKFNLKRKLYNYLRLHNAQIKIVKKN